MAFMKNKEQKTVLALGELLIDFTCEKTDGDGFPTMAAHPGGAPANFLAAVAKFGGEAEFIGKVGNDAFGRALKAKMEACAIGTRGLIVSDEVFTTLAFVTLDESGDREFSFARKPGADTCLKTEEIRTELLEQADVFHFGTLSLTDEPAKSATMAAVAKAKAEGCLISFDPNLRKPLWDDLERAKEAMLWGLEQADIVKISDEEAEFLFGLEPKEALQEIFERYPVRLLYVTCGKDGAYFKNENAFGFVPALKGIKVVDTTGAGDIFGGSAMWRFLEKKKAPEALTEEELYDVVRFAATAAGLSTTKAGGISSVPTLSEVLERM